MRSSRRRVSLALLTLVVGCGAPAEETGTSAQFAMVCGRGPTVEGIDVSEYQRTVDWAMVRASGRRYAIARVAHLPRIDPTFARNWAGIRAAGMIRGAYLYFDPNADAAMQADIVVNAVGRLRPGDLPVTLDVEKPQPGLPAPDVYAARIRTFVQRVTAGTGRAPMIYTGAYYWPSYVRTREFNTLPLWHAQYTSARCPTIADAWSDWSFWQYSSTGRVPGITGNVDLDRFNGTFEELQRLAGIGTAMDASVPRDATIDAPRADIPRPDAARMDAPIDVQRNDIGADTPRADAPRDAPDAAVDAPRPTDVSAPDVVTEDAPAEDVPAQDAVVEDVPEAVEPAAETGGCGCRTSASRARGTWVIALLGLSLARRRRAQARRASRASQRAISDSTSARAASSEDCSVAASVPPRA